MTPLAVVVVGDILTWLDVGKKEGVGARWVEVEVAGSGLGWVALTFVSVDKAVDQAEAPVAHLVETVLLL